jgi:hypothetical protein
MSFIVEKDGGLIPNILSSILGESGNDVTLADPDLRSIIRDDFKITVDEYWVKEIAHVVS